MPGDVAVGKTMVSTTQLDGMHCSKPGTGIPLTYSWGSAQINHGATTPESQLARTHHARNIEYLPA